jgi:hypothetical protein
MWLRELPDPLLTNSLHQGFVEAASMFHRRITLSQKMQIDFFLATSLTEIENDRLRHIRLHERVNDLPDSNYSTLKFFLGHLHR